MLEPNHIYNTDCVSGLAEMEPGSASLIIADPPYFRVKGDFDFKWGTRGEYLAEAEKWAAACERALSPTGTLIWYGSDEMTAYNQVMLNRHFRFLNSCTVVKRNSIQNSFSSVESSRSFLVNEERFLVYESNGSEASEGNPAVLARNRHAYEEGLCHTRCVRPVIDRLRAMRERAGVSAAEINAALGLGAMAGHWFTTGSQFVFPTREHYEKMTALFRERAGLADGTGCATPCAEYDSLRKEYDALRKEYDALRRPFDLHGKRQSDVFSISVDSGVSARLGHPTVKDWGLTRLLIDTCSRPGDLVVAPFAGSGTECAGAASLGRKYIGFETNPAYWEKASLRAKREADGYVPGLFGDAPED